MDTIILERWCVGAAPQSEDNLASPCNALDEQEDPDGLWRAHANACLKHSYQPLFTRLDTLIYLAAPNFACVERRRNRQEELLRQTRAFVVDALTDAAGIHRFVQQFNRLTRHCLETLPAVSSG